MASPFWAARSAVAMTERTPPESTATGFSMKTCFPAAIEAGKHVFMEKPVAVDSGGVRSVMATADLAAQKGLAIVAGTQRRHDAGYRAAIQRIHDGGIGDLVGGQVYWNQGGLWMHPRE